jgi:hypothetical protein
MYHIREIERYRVSKRSSDVEIASTFSRQLNDQNANIIIFSEGVSATGITSDVSQCGSHVHGIDSMKYSWVENNQNVLFGRGINTTNTGCPSILKELEMGIAADCGYIKEHGGTKNALTQIISNINIASALFEKQFNVSLVIIRVVFAEQCTLSGNVTRWNQDCNENCTSNTLLLIIDNMKSRLSDFSYWRGFRANDTLGLWHLMTKCPSQPSVGLAWRGQICETTARKQDDGFYISGTVY